MSLGPHVHQAALAHMEPVISINMPLRPDIFECPCRRRIYQIEEGIVKEFRMQRDLKNNRQLYAPYSQMPLERKKT